MTAPTQTQPWASLSSEAKRDLVKPMWAAGQSAAQIAKQVGASRNAVIGVVHRMNAAGKGPQSRSPHRARTEPVAATETTGNDLRKPAAVVSGQIVREGDAPREADQGEAACSAHPATEFPSPTTSSSRSKAPAGTGKVAASSVPANSSDPVANVGEGANGALAAAPVDPASRDADGADRQQPVVSGFTGEDDGRDVETSGGTAPVITISRAAAWDEIPGIEPVTLLQLDPGICKWPVFEGDEPRLFCGAPCDPTGPYCCSHAALSRSPFQPSPTRKAAA